MKRVLALLAATLMLSMSQVPGQAQTRRELIMFYNVENVFDTIKSPGVYDEEFTPEGAKAWNSHKYWSKMANLEKVFASISEENKQFPTIIGLSEIENRNVLEDIADLEKLRGMQYQIVHYDSPDARGVDVAFLYRPDRFQYEGSYPVKTVVEGLPNFRTRDILTMWGTIDGERFMFMVAHWPSRLGGQSASEPRRVGAAKTMRHVADSVIRENPGIKIVMMGDFNDDPSDKSLAEVLGGKLRIEEAGPTGFYNPFWQLHKDGYGSLAYQDSWNLFDNMIVSGTLVNGDDDAFQLWKPRRGKYYGFIYDRPFLRQKSGQYKNYPLRTYVGNNFQNGYSDHFPVYIFIAR